MGSVAKQISNHFQQAMGMARFFRREKNYIFFYPRNTSPTWTLLLFIMELVSAAKMGTCETTATPVMICYIGYTNLTGMYE